MPDTLLRAFADLPLGHSFLYTPTIRVKSADILSFVPRTTNTKSRASENTADWTGLYKPLTDFSIFFIGYLFMRLGRKCSSHEVGTKWPGEEGTTPHGCHVHGGGVAFRSC